MSSEQVLRPRPLKNRFFLTAGLYLMGITVGGWLLPLTERQLINFWSAAGAVLLFQLAMLWHFLPQNRRPTGSMVLPTLGLGNGLTLMRGLLLALLAGFLLLPEPPGWVAWVPVGLYTIADLLDFFDGLAARLTDHVTQLGEKLDMELDSLGIGFVVALIILYEKAGWWFAAVALARYLFVFGLWWRRRTGRPIYELTDSRFRRLIAGYNMGFLSVALWPIMTRGAVSVGAAAFVTPLLLIFGRDWLVASGRLDPANATYRRWRARLQGWANGWLPLAARLAIAVTAVTSGVWSLSGSANRSWFTLLASWGWPAGSQRVAVTVLTILAIVTLLAVILGVWARWLALAALLPVAVEVISSGVSWATWDGAVLGAAVCLIAIVNSGRFSLLPPRDWYMYQRLGGE